MTTLLLEAFKRLLEAEFEVIGAAADGRALVAAARTLKPDVIVLDIAMPLLNRLESSSATARDVAAPQADFSDHESGSGSGGCSVASGRFGLPPKDFCCLRADQHHP